MRVKGKHKNNDWGIIGTIFFLFIATKPIYLRGSGSVQISELFLILLFFIFFIQKPYIIVRGNNEKKWVKVFLVIVIYQISINAIWTVILQKRGYVGSLNKASLYYVFNLIVVIVILRIRKYLNYKNTEHIFLCGIIVACIISCIGLLITYTSRSSRQTGFFNNPNQLGYFSIVALTVAVIFKNELSKRAYGLIIICSLIMNIFSLSKASLLSGAVLLLINSTINRKSAKGFIKKIISIIMVFTLIFLLMYSSIPAIANNRTIAMMRWKINRMGVENDSDFGEGRGYNRILEVGANIIIGTGEGINSRFMVKPGKEVHSMYASLLTCYGIFGLAAYLYLFLLQCMSSHERYKTLLLFSGIMLYCLSHNGVRNTMVWTLLTMLMMKETERIDTIN